MGISFRRKGQLSGDVIWSVFEKVAQSNSRFYALHKLVVTVHSFRKPVGFGRGVKTMGRPISAMAHLKRNIVEVKAEENCLAHVLIIAISRVNNDPNYNSYRRGYKKSSRSRTCLKQQVSIWIEGVGSANSSGLRTTSKNIESLSLRV